MANYKITINSVQNEAVANAVIEVGDTILLNSHPYSVVAVSPGATAAETDVFVEGDEAPAANATIFIKKADGRVPLGTDSIPGLVTKRLRSYMETPNTAHSVAGSGNWDVLDVDGVSAAELFTVGDWMRVNGVEYLIQGATATSAGVYLVTAPPAPTEVTTGIAYHYIVSGSIPLATANTPGIIPHTYSHDSSEYVQIDLYIPNFPTPTSGASGSYDSLKYDAKDNFLWMGPSINVEAIYYWVYQVDSKANINTVETLLVTADTRFISDIHSITTSMTWLPFNVPTGSVINTGDIVTITRGWESSSANDSEGIRVSIIGSMGAQAGA